MDLKYSKSDNESCLQYSISFCVLSFKYPQMCSLTGQDLLFAMEGRFLISGSKNKEVIS